MKGEGKTFLKSKMKWVVLAGLVLSGFSIALHFLLARFTQAAFSEFQSSITIFSWRPIFQNRVGTFTNSSVYPRLWGPVRKLEFLHPDANPRGYYPDPKPQSNGFIFVRIQGGFHEIRNSICDVVAISRMLNATLVVPEIQSTTSSKGISSQFKSFAYLYNEEQFMAALAKDINVVRTLPKSLKWARKKKAIPVFQVPYLASPYYFLHHVLPILVKHSVVELVVSHGGCLEAILPPHLEEYQRLRCRVAFHALRFRQEVQELATKILQRLRVSGQPFIAYDPGLTREALAYYGCAELFQDVHAELIQHKRAWAIKRGLAKGQLSVNSEQRRLNGSCPLMPEEVGILLRAYGYSSDTIIYVSGGEVFGGQRILIPLHATFENVVDRTLLSTSWELTRIYGREPNLDDVSSKSPQHAQEETKFDAWKNAGPRPRPLPPPPARPKTYNVEGWWGWVAESDNEPESTVVELRTNAHKLLWEAIDYLISVDADVYIAGFNSDGKGHPNFASLVMGHRLYQSATSKTFHPNRREVVKLLDEIRENVYEANQTWLRAVRRHLRTSLLDGLGEASNKSKPLSFLSHPIPECSCLRSSSAKPQVNASTSASPSQIPAGLGEVLRCPSWMDGDTSSDERGGDTEEDLDEDDLSSSGLFFHPSDRNRDSGAEEANGKEEAQLDDQDELDGGDR